MGLHRPVVRVLSLGRISYTAGLQFQTECVRRHKNGLSGSVLVSETKPLDTLLLCEHSPPVYTVGMRQAAYPSSEEARLRQLGAEFFRTDRGGLITFHGPGQLVCYPVLNLAHFQRKSIRWYIDQLERTMMELCHRYGLETSTSSDRGIWVKDNKICALGVHCGRYITSHGLALNCNTDLGWFEHIVPCGIEGKGVTSLSKELKRNVTVAEVTLPFLEVFEQQFMCTLTISEMRDTSDGFAAWL